MRCIAVAPQLPSIKYLNLQVKSNSKFRELMEY